MSVMPTTYRQPFGMPYHWRDEVTGRLACAVEHYLDARIENTPCYPEELETVRDYCQHFINAPCWEPSGFSLELAELRLTIEGVTTDDELAAWIMSCMDIGLDPL